MEAKAKSAFEDRTKLQQERVALEREVKKLKQGINILQKAKEKADSVGDKKLEPLEKEVGCDSWRFQCSRSLQPARCFQGLLSSVAQSVLEHICPLHRHTQLT